MRPVFYMPPPATVASVLYGEHIAATTATGAGPTRWNRLFSLVVGAFVAVAVAVAVVAAMCSPYSTEATVAGGGM